MNRYPLLALLIASPVTAAPPTLTSLFPAGASCGKSVEVTAAGSFSRWPVQAWCSDRGVSLTPLMPRGRFNVKVAADATPGVVWVRLHDEEGASPLQPFLVGVLPEVSELEPNNDVRTALKVEPAGVVVNGQLDKPGDVDCFAVALKKGQTLVADVTANETLGSPMDGVLQVLSKEGFVLAENNDDRGLDPRLAFTAPAEGTYFARLFAFPSQPDSSIRFAGAETYIYRLTLTAGPLADHAFPLAVSRQSPADIEIIGWNLPEAARRLKVPPGEQDERTLFDPRFIHLIRVRVVSHSCVVEKEPNARGTPQPLTAPVTISGRIDPPGDRDAYRFAVKKGQPLLVQLESKALGFPLEGMLRLTDVAGKSLLEQQATAGRDPSLSYTPSTDGELQVEVGDLYQHGGPRHVYCLRIAPPEPSVALTLKADRFTTAAGKPLAIPIAVAVRNGFKEEIELLAEELPEGVQVAPVKWTPAKGNNVALSLMAAKGPRSGAMRLIGKSNGRTIPVTANGKSALWLTVPR